MQVSESMCFLIFQHVMLHEKDYHIYHEWPCLENLETGLKETDGKQVANAA